MSVGSSAWFGSWLVELKSGFIHWPFATLQILRCIESGIFLYYSGDYLRTVTYLNASREKQSLLLECRSRNRLSKGYRSSYIIRAICFVSQMAFATTLGTAILLPNVQGEPRSWLARLVLLGARGVTAKFVGSSAWFGSFA